jgi:hypothetical protein
LVSLLDSHPNIICVSRYAKQSFSSLEALWDERFTKKSEATAFGVKVFCYAYAKEFPVDTIWPRLSDFKVILLRRKNLLDRFLSAKLVQANLNGEQSWADVVYRQPVKINPKALYADIMRRIEEERRLEEYFSQQERLVVYYEDLQEQLMLDFLGVPSHNLCSSLVKQRVKSQREMIINYDEVKAFFADTDFARFFEE